MCATQAIPDALLFTAPGCPHCPALRRALDDLVAAGLVGRLEVVDLAADPGRAEDLGVRAVPWLRLGEFEFEGLHSAAELRHWARRAASAGGLGEYFAERLKNGRLTQVAAMVAAQPARLDALLQLAADADTELTVRIGVSAVVEGLAGSQALRASLPTLHRLAASGDARVRADACHFLALSASRAALPTLETLSRDSERAVREVALDCLAELRESSDG